MSRARLCQNNINNTSFVNERLREAREAMRGKQRVRKVLEDDCETPGKFKGVDGETCDSPSDTRPRKITPMDLIKTVNCTRNVFMCVCVHARERTEVMSSSMRRSSAQKRKASKQALFILVFILVPVRRRGINSCILHSQKCVRCEMFEKRQQQQQAQGPCLLQ